MVFASSGIMACEVHNLAHEFSDNPVKGGILILSLQHSEHENLCCLWNFVCRGDAAQGPLIVMSKNLVGVTEAASKQCLQSQGLHRFSLECSCL